MSATIAQFTVVKGGRRPSRAKRPSAFVQLAARLERERPQDLEFLEDLMTDLLNIRSERECVQ